MPHGSHMHCLGAPHALYLSHMGDVNQMGTLRTIWEPYGATWEVDGAPRQPDDTYGSSVGAMWLHVESMCTVCTIGESSGMREELYAPYGSFGLSYGRCVSLY
jgi:hypothetical protein